MVLILSSSSDAHIEYVIDWLKYYDHEYIRFNADDITSGDFYFSISEQKIILKGVEIYPDKINAIWYRKWGWFKRSNYFGEVKNKIARPELEQLSREYGTILNSIVTIFKDKKWLTPPWTITKTKPDMIACAQKNGLRVPKSWIISSKEDILRSLADNKELIVKSVFEHHFIIVEDGYYPMFTCQIDDTDAIPDKFFPSLVQEKINKDYELRIFYLNGDFYPMAIFSQSNKLTEMDFRKFDYTTPNRYVPYKIPDKLKEQLRNLLKDTGLDCCSIDMIKSASDGEYYFLEINPTGAFGMTSMPCNYEVFKNVALTLIKMDKEYEKV